MSRTSLSTPVASEFSDELKIQIPAALIAPAALAAASHLRQAPLLLWLRPKILVECRYYPQLIRFNSNSHVDPTELEDYLGATDIYSQPGSQSNTT